MKNMLVDLKRKQKENTNCKNSKLVNMIKVMRIPVGDRLVVLLNQILNGEVKLVR